MAGQSCPEEPHVRRGPAPIRHAAEQGGTGRKHERELIALRRAALTDGDQRLKPSHGRETGDHRARHRRRTQQLSSALGLGRSGELSDRGRGSTDTRQVHRQHPGVGVHRRYLPRCSVERNVTSAIVADSHAGHRFGSSVSSDALAGWAKAMSRTVAATQATALPPLKLRIIPNYLSSRGWLDEHLRRSPQIKIPSVLHLRPRAPLLSRCGVNGTRYA
jgi:hypothetical protein